MILQWIGHGLPVMDGIWDAVRWARLAAQESPSLVARSSFAAALLRFESYACCTAGALDLACPTTVPPAVETAASLKPARAPTCGTAEETNGVVHWSVGACPAPSLTPCAQDSDCGPSGWCQSGGCTAFETLTPDERWPSWLLPYAGSTGTTSAAQTTSDEGFAWAEHYWGIRGVLLAGMAGTVTRSPTAGDSEAWDLSMSAGGGLQLHSMWVLADWAQAGIYASYLYTPVERSPEGSGSASHPRFHGLGVGGSLKFGGILARDPGLWLGFALDGGVHASFVPRGDSGWAEFATFMGLELVPQVELQLAFGRSRPGNGVGISFTAGLRTLPYLVMIGGDGSAAETLWSLSFLFTLGIEYGR
jgi:hypothetical protein